MLQWKPSPQNEDAEAEEGEGIPELEDLMEEIRSELRAAKEQEERLVTCIVDELQKTEKVLGSSNFQRFFDHSVARVNTEFECAEGNARQLASSLETLSGLAQNISGRVAALDLGKSRVVDCLQRVNDLRDLGTCASGVQEAIKEENYEEAARNIHRFLTLDSAVFKMGDPEEKGAGYSVKNCYEVLRQATTELKGIIENKFDTAKAKGDVITMERFFKLFPLLNEHQSGLRRFGAHLCDKIADLGEQNFKIMQAGGTDDNRRNVLFADTLTMIFEGIARLVELHQPIINNCYGQDKLLDLIEIIGPECDKQTGRVLDAFMQKRQFEDKARQLSNLLRNQANLASQADRVDAIELDVLLSEVTLMHTRAELFWRFLRRRLNRADAKGEAQVRGKAGSANKEEQFIEDDREFESEEQRKDFLEKMKQSREERAKKLDSVLNHSKLNTRMQELLGKYVLMEQYYMTQSVQKAISMDTVEEGAITSSLLDDVFFIVRKSIRRSISSASVDCICAMLNNGVTLLETDFLKYISAPIKSGYPNVGWTAEAYQTAQSAYSAVLQQGKGVPEIASTEKQRTAFLVALNNLRTSVECVCKLKAGLAEDFQKHLSQMTNTESKKVENAVSQLDDFAKRLEQHSNLGVGKICEAAFRPKLKSNVEEFLEISHILSEEELAEFEFNDPFMANFIVQLDTQLSQFEPLLVPENYKALVASVSAEALQQLERCIFKCSFNRLGAMQLDKEFRELTSYLTSIAGWGIREKCNRLSQIITLINSESLDEAILLLQQLQDSSVIAPTILSQNDRRRTLSLREDFRDKVVARLKAAKM